MKRSFIPIVAAFLVLFPVVVPEAIARRSLPVKAAVVMDADGEVLFSKYPNAKLAPASTVKLVTAMVVLDRLAPDTVVTVSRNASRVRTITPKLCPEEQLTVADLLHLALMRSINSAAVTLAEAAAGSEDAFAALMNEKARELGAGTTLFANATGLPKGRQYSTASDLVLILKAALAYPLIREILGTKVYVAKTTAGRELLVENSNDLLWYDRDMIGGKTGYTGNARHCFVCAVNTEKGTLYMAILGARSRHGLWRSTLLLNEIALKQPEMALLHVGTPIAPALSHSVR